MDTRCVLDTHQGNVARGNASAQEMSEKSVGSQPMVSKYLHYVPNLWAETSGGVMVWKLPQDFCQSRLGDRVTGSNACTLITILLAQRCHQMTIQVLGQMEQPLSKLFLTALAEAIVEGNDIHERVMAIGIYADPYLTFPEATQAAGRRVEGLIEWETWYGIGTLMPKIELYLEGALDRWCADEGLMEHDLYAVLVGGGRSVLLMFQRETQRLTLTDSHSHWAWATGALVAQVTKEGLRDLCVWYARLCDDCYGAQPVEFELTFFYFVVTGHDQMDCNHELPRHPDLAFDIAGPSGYRRHRNSPQNRARPSPQPERTFWEWLTEGSNQGGAGDSENVEESLERDYETRGSLQMALGAIDDSSSSSGAESLHGRAAGAMGGGGDFPQAPSDFMLMMRMAVIGVICTTVFYFVSFLDAWWT